MTLVHIDKDVGIAVSVVGNLFIGGATRKPLINITKTCLAIHDAAIMPVGYARYYALNGLISDGIYSGIKNRFFLWLARQLLRRVRH